MRPSWLTFAANAAWRARQEADAAQRVLSEVKVFLALLPDGTRLELRAPKPASALPAELLGVRPHLPASSAPPRIPLGAAAAAPGNGGSVYPSAPSPKLLRH
jgi:hypothetical protein